MINIFLDRYMSILNFFPLFQDDVGMDVYLLLP